MAEYKARTIGAACTTLVLDALVAIFIKCAVLQSTLSMTSVCPFRVDEAGYPIIKATHADIGAIGVYVGGMDTGLTAAWSNGCGGCGCRGDYSGR